MSKVIRDDHPWSESEIAYQLARGRVKEVELNKKRFPAGSSVKHVEPEDDSVVLELSKEVYEYVSSRTIPELKSELKKNHLPLHGDETMLRVTLAQHLQGLEDAANA